MNVTENFTLKELTSSQTAKRNGYDEQFNPPLDIIDNLTVAAEAILEPIRAKFGAFSISQGYRCERLNKAVNGAKNSEHMKGMAFDIDLGSRNLELFNWIKENLTFTQLINEFPENGVPDWVHVSYNQFNLKQQVLTAYKENGATKYK